MTDDTRTPRTPDGDPGDTPVCSAKGCRSTATWSIVWNNPKVHTPDREKIWVACDDHKQSLSEHLSVRGFFKRVDPLGT